MYDEKARMAVLDYYFAAPDATFEQVISHFGYPSVRALQLWVSSDPRKKDPAFARTRVTPNYSDDDKRAFINYAAAHPRASVEELVVSLGYPSCTCALGWLKEAGIARRKRPAAASFTKEQKRAVCEYAVAHPEVPYDDVAALFGYPKAGTSVRCWCVELYGPDCRPQGPYTQEEKDLAVELVFAQPERAVNDICRDPGFPVPRHVAFPLVRADPRWASDPRNPELKHALRRDIVETYFGDVSLRYTDVSEAFGGAYSPSGVMKLVRKDFRFGDASFYGFTVDQRDRVLDLCFSDTAITHRELERTVGFKVPARVYYEWRTLDPRSCGMPRRRPEPRTIAEKWGCVSLVVLDGKSREDAAALCGVHKSSATNWLRAYRRKGLVSLVTKKDLPPRRRTDLGVADKDPGDYTPDEVAALKERIAELEFENDALHGIFDVLKKDPGLDECKLTNKEKTLLINSLRPKYRLKPLLERFEISKSSYEYNARALERPDKHAALRVVVRKVFEDSGHAYGYRRIKGAIRKPVDEGGYGRKVGDRLVRRIIREEGLRTLPAKKMEKYSSYRGTVGKVAPNLLQGDFSADAPFEKLLTDITEFHLNGYKIYLSPMLDCYNGEIIARTIGLRPQTKLVMDMLQKAKLAVGPDKKPTAHSDQGCQYQSRAYVDALKEAGWVQSMSRKGCCCDNSAMEGFFGRLKNEFFYNHDFTGYTPEAFMKELDAWIDWHNNTRIKESLGFLSPAEYRLKHFPAAA